MDHDMGARRLRNGKQALNPAHAKVAQMTTLTGSGFMLAFATSNWKFAIQTRASPMYVFPETNDVELL
jgi:hypothetical protein